MWILLHKSHLVGGPKGDRHERPHWVDRVTAWLYSQTSSIGCVDWASDFFLENECLPLMLRDSLSNGVHPRPHRLGRSILPFIRISHFFRNLVFMAPEPSRALSASTNLGLSCHVSGILECEVAPDPCSLPCSPKCILSLLSSLKNKRPGPQPVAWG